jgi:uncharacterized linocin/CFP29 family protein
MDDRNAQVGWSEAQWNRVREEVLRAWQSVRVAGSVLPIYGPLPPSTQVVPSEKIQPDGSIDERSVAALLEISLPVKLSRQQVKEDDLSGALLQFRRRAVQLGQLEDWYVFNGTYPYKLAPSKAVADLIKEPYRPRYPFLRTLDADIKDVLRGVPQPIGDQDLQREGLLMRNPGALGLIEGAREVDQKRTGNSISSWDIRRSRLDYAGLLNAVVDAISTLEQHGYVAPYACVVGRGVYAGANKPAEPSTVLPRDRLEPLIGGEMLHAAAIDVPSEGGDASEDTEWPRRGLLFSRAGEAVDLVVAVEATAAFEYVDPRGRYVFSVFERFALRIKDPKAIVPIRFEEASEDSSELPFADRVAEMLRNLFPEAAGPRSVTPGTSTRSQPGETPGGGGGARAGSGATD